MKKLKKTTKNFKVCACIQINKRTRVFLIWIRSFKRLKNLS